MKIRIPWAIASFFAVLSVVAASSQPKGNSKPPAPPKPQVFSPGFDDLMTMLVQPRHVRLYFAGRQKNWELAAAELRDLQQSFDRLAQVVPNYQGNDVNASVKSLIAPQMQAIQAAIDSADVQKFNTAYRNLTTACNACHTYLEHPYIVIKVPDGPNDTAHPDQSYAPAP